ncbi:hypothetical protein F5144DRAFT_627179 [Chaetomium tenue]|uniref:Uncharacterized protein n=1 Tax=Chaetomium tenue TaxID=1854479 RepID=A0ACB7PK64_9PEZI|nr:hypothetical protein F5144DRAFT_627179 [Chaetomium globosum]
MSDANDNKKSDPLAPPNSPTNHPNDSAESPKDDTGQAAPEADHPPPSPVNGDENGNHDVFISEVLSLHLWDLDPVVKAESARHSSCPHSFDMERLRDKFNDLFATEMASYMKGWAEAEQKAITKSAQPRFFLLKKDTTVIWTKKGETSLVIPLFIGTTEVLVRAWDSNAGYQIQWYSEFVLHLDEETGIRPLAQDLIFHYNLFRLEGNAQAERPAEQEEEGDESDGKPQENLE